MGLPKSEHIGKILIDPRNSSTVYVAAEGPLWSAGGERGLYKSIDGGKTWTLSLQIDENTGVTDVEFDPSNPDILYAAAYQRRRHTWSLLAGGPQSGIYKSEDKGTTWRKITKGLPNADMGKIGLAVTPSNPNLVYATIESDAANKGFYLSTDKGESWKKQNSYTSGGTGPHYYQEIEASPTDPDLIYQMDVFLHVTKDGGKNFDYLGNGREKHSDNHALWIDPTNGKHLIAGTDGGLYESFDGGEKWRHFPNLPISQFYKIAVDNATPYFNIVAGAQDLGTLIGPSQTTNTEGVLNRDWYIPLGADGYDAAFDPEAPNTVYMEIQGGLLHRLDRKTQEVINIQPQPGPDDPAERFNWDSPVIISPHDNSTLYFGSQRLWKSTDKGNSWSPISKDLTTNKNRYELQMMDNVPGISSLYDNGAMSKYATLTSIAESTVQKGILYTGSDDGMLYASLNDGETWKKMSALPKVPALSFINDIEASQHEANTLFVSADAHKIGDYKPYLFMSRDNGSSWISIVGDLPAETIVWGIKQDYEDPNLLFIAAEYGLYFSPNMGKNWIKLNAGVPTISFRDLEIHERNGALIGGSFGRGIYVLDDYTPLRELSKTAGSMNNTVVVAKDAWWYIPNVPMQAKGMPSQSSYSYKAPNPEFGALITCYVKEIPKTKKSERLEKEKQLSPDMDVPFPGWDQLREENLESEPSMMVLISDEGDQPLRWIQVPSKEGVHQVTWDLRLPAPDPISLSQPAFKPPWVGDPQGPLVAPGKYSAQMFILAGGQLQPQGEKKQFMVKAAPNATVQDNYEETVAFMKKAGDMSRIISGYGRTLGESSEKLRYMKEAIKQTSSASPDLFETWEKLNRSLADLRQQLYGDQIKGQYDESSVPGIAGRVGQVIYGHWNTTQEPTTTQKRNIEIAEAGLSSFDANLKGFMAAMEEYEAKLKAAGAPWTPGRE